MLKWKDLLVHRDEKTNYTLFYKNLEQVLRIIVFTTIFLKTVEAYIFRYILQLAQNVYLYTMPLNII